MAAVAHTGDAGGGFRTRAALRLSTRPARDAPALGQGGTGGSPRSRRGADDTRPQRDSRVATLLVRVARFPVRHLNSPDTPCVLRLTPTPFPALTRAQRPAEGSGSNSRDQVTPSSAKGVAMAELPWFRGEAGDAKRQR